LDGCGRACSLSFARIVLTALVASGLWLSQAGGTESSLPFAPAPPQKPKQVRLLAFAESLDPRALEAFERATGYAVAYDAYALAVEIPDKWKDGPYDVVVLPGPALSRRIALGALQKLDRHRLSNAHAIQPAVDQKLAVYDPGDAHSAPFGWAPYGLLYDADKVSARLGGPPSSWSALFDPRFSRRLADCGVAAPNARDAMFLAAWRFAGVDPLRARPLDIKLAAAAIGRAKPAMQGFALADPVGGLARGAFCLTAGTPGEAEAANVRAKLTGTQVHFGFIEPKEGGGVEIDAFAVPRDAPNPDIAYKLIDFLLTPGVALENARLAGLSSSEAAPDPDLMKRLWPLGAFDENFAQAMETEWTHLRTSK
jgi:putrescine transport system substrate-binding protein